MNSESGAPGTGGLPEQPDRGVALQREQAMRKLALACADGRLTLAELTARTETVSRAVTYEELRRVTADLPGARQGTVAGPRRGARRLLVGVFGLCGRWPFPALRPRVLAIAAFGEVEIDLCRSPLTSFETRISAVAVAGEVRIIVPRGVRAEVRRTPIAGWITAPSPGFAHAGPAGPLAPVVRINALAVLGDVRIEEPGI